MELFAEFILEILGELLMEGGAQAASSRRLPIWARVLILAVLGLLFLAVFAILLLVGIAAFQELPLLSLFLLALDAAWIFFGVRKLRKILRTFRHQSFHPFTEPRF